MQATAGPPWLTIVCLLDRLLRPPNRLYVCVIGQLRKHHSLRTCASSLCTLTCIWVALPYRVAILWYDICMLVSLHEQTAAVQVIITEIEEYPPSPIHAPRWQPRKLVATPSGNMAFAAENPGSQLQHNLSNGASQLSPMDGPTNTPVWQWKRTASGNMPDMSDLQLLSLHRTISLGVTVQGTSPRIQLHGPDSDGAPAMQVVLEPVSPRALWLAAAVAQHEATVDMSQQTDAAYQEVESVMDAVDRVMADTYTGLYAAAANTSAEVRKAWLRQVQPGSFTKRTWFKCLQPPATGSGDMQPKLDRVKL